MKWDGNRESDNVEDRRGEGGSGGGGFGIGGGSIGIGSIVIALVASYFLGINPLTVLSFLSGGDAPTAQVQQGPAHKPPANDQQAKFVSVVLADTEDVWKQVFTKGGATYTPPKLVLFRGSTPTPCGAGQSAMGPFYCPGDQKVYIDLAFYDTLSRQLGAPGEFAKAYVVAHEIGHHVQNLLGVNDKVEQARRRLSEKENNALSVRVELQADCYAGLWAKKANESRQILENGDIEAAMNAAAKIGDDALQRASTGQIRPDSFTHGTSEQRVRWFNTGLQTGSVKSCDTFNTRAL
ncbi:MAG: neutral zinc metallopeptidase [Burkholderiaceae bacterium]|nr:neutral zinc metallopeptidase [Burkholderiaceae bacterium]